METINLEVTINKGIAVDIPIEEIINGLNKIPLTERWNAAAQILNQLHLDVKDMRPAQIDYIKEYVRRLGVLLETNEETIEKKAQAEAEKKKTLINLLLWMHYGNCKSSVEQFDGFVAIFLKATSGDYEFCQCKDKCKAVNDIWEELHCTFCLKPIKLI